MMSVCFERRPSHRLACTTNARYSFGNELTPRWIIKRTEQQRRRRRRWLRMLRIAMTPEYCDSEVVWMLGPQRPIRQFWSRRGQFVLTHVYHFFTHLTDLRETTTVMWKKREAWVLQGLLHTNQSNQIHADWLMATQLPRPSCRHCVRYFSIILLNAFVLI